MGIEGKELRQKWRRGGEETGAMAWNHIYKLRQKTENKKCQSEMDRCEQNEPC